MTAFEKYFWNFVEKNGPIPAHRPEIGKCWVWKNGSGRQPRIKFRGRQWLASRVAFVLKHRRMPSGKNVLHRCDNSRCVRWSHLWTGTQADNLNDMRNKGRHAARVHPIKFSKSIRGENNGGAKISETAVKNILASRKIGSSYSVLIRCYGLKKTQIARICKRQSWRHVR